MTAAVLSSSPLALLLYLCLLVVPHLCQVLSTCRAGNATECRSASYVPGHALAGQGFDVVKLQRTASYVIDVQSYLNPTNSCTLCLNPLLGDTLQKLPLAVQAWSSDGSCSLALSSAAFTSVSSLAGAASSAVQNDWRSDLGLAGLTSRQLEGSRSAMSLFASNRARQDKSLFTLHQMTCSHYNFSIFSVPPLNPEFHEQSLSLPRNLTRHTLPLYQRFISTYGTHYVSQLDLGGQLRRTTALRTCLASLNKASVSGLRDCLRVGVSVGLGLQPSSALSSKCRTTLGGRDGVAGYALGFLNHMTELTGGGGWNGEVSLFRNDSLGFHTWLSSLRSNPDQVSYSLQPLHTLVPDATLSANLRTAVRQYITDNGMSKTHQQPYCRNRPNLSSQCCPLQVHRGRLEVKVIRAWGLNGDIGGRSEGYVKLWYGNSYRKTRWIRSNSPRWDAYYDYGNVHTGERLRLQVWDKDVTYDDYLGGCHVYLRNGDHYHTCRLRRGGFAFSYRLTCDNHLTGSKCNLYTPSLR